MSKKEQLLILKPSNELVFNGNFMKGATKRLSLINPTDKKIMYKIKTTAPKKYCVRPNGGTIEPKASADIFIYLVPDVLDPNELNKHKFMVQSIVAPDDDLDDIENVWKEISPDQIMGSKLRCVFEGSGTVSAKSDTEQSAAFIKGETNNKGTSESDQNTSEDVFKPQDTSRENIDFEDRHSKTGSQLRQKNLEQEEAVLRELHQTHTESATIKDKKPLLGSSSISSAASSITQQHPQFQNTYSPPPVVNQQIPPSFIALAVFLVVFGLLIGKFLL